MLKFALCPSKKIASFDWKSLKMMKNAFYFILKDLSVQEIFKFLSWLFGYVEKRPDKKTQVNFKMHDVVGWTTNKNNTYILQYLKK